MSGAARPMHAMVLAAGRGERMRPLTDTTPKPLLEVKGKPLLAWHLQALRAAGVAHAVINVAHLGDQIIDFVRNHQAFGLDVRFSKEPEGALETAGGIATAEPWRDGHGRAVDSPFLVINADVWTDWPMDRAMVIRDTDFGAAEPTDCHLVLVDNPPHHPKGDFCLGQDGAPLTFSGIGVYDRRMFSAIAAQTRAPLAPLLHHAIAQGRARWSHHTGVWNDIGTPERLAELNGSA